MASTIAALTAGGGGVATTADSSGNLNLLSGTTTVLALTATGIAVTGTLTSSGVLSATSPTFVTPVIDSATVATVSGTAPLYMCRAWVNFDGTGTPAIRASGNVSSITDNGTGAYTINFTTAIVDTNYGLSAWARASNSYFYWVSAGAAATKTASALGIFVTRNDVGNTEDVTEVDVTIFR